MKLKSKPASKKDVTNSVKRKVRKLLMWKRRVFVRILFENPAAHKNLSEELLLIGFNDKLKVITVLDGSEVKALLLSQTGDRKIVGVEEIDQKDISRELGRLRRHIKS
jgi:hypothetical protein